jgi:transposase-like protein
MMTREERRAAVRRLAQPGTSARAIATILGVGKDTVRRDLEALAQAGAPTGEPLAQPVAPDDAPPAQPAQRGALPGESAHLTVPQRAPVCARDITGPAMTVAVDRQLLDDLAVLARAGWRTGAAVGRGVQLLADAHRGAVAGGHAAPGQMVDVQSMTLDPAYLRPQPAAAAPVARPSGAPRTGWRTAVTNWWRTRPRHGARQGLGVA